MLFLLVAIFYVELLNNYMLSKFENVTFFR